MTRRISDIPYFELGQELRAAMKHAGINGKMAARKIGWSQSVLSRLLNGRRRPQKRDVEALLDLCGVPQGNHRNYLLGLTTQHAKDGTNQLSWLPQRRRRYFDHILAATTITTFQTQLIPGFLRTDTYIRAVVGQDATLPEDQGDFWCAVDQAQRIPLSRQNPPTLTAFLHESVLNLPVGGPDVMAEQLAYLLRLSQRPHICIRVVPASLGAHPSPTGSFTLIESQRYQPVIHLDTATTGVFLGHVDDITTYHTILDAIAKTALTEQNTTNLIAATAENLAERAPSAF